MASTKKLARQNSPGSTISAGARVAGRYSERWYVKKYKSKAIERRNTEHRYLGVHLHRHRRMSRRENIISISAHVEHRRKYREN